MPHVVPPESPAGAPPSSQLSVDSVIAWYLLRHAWGSEWQADSVRATWLYRFKKASSSTSGLISGDD
jgi:hypothetical protein